MSTCKYASQYTYSIYDEDVCTCTFASSGVEEPYDHLSGFFLTSTFASSGVEKPYDHLSGLPATTYSRLPSGHPVWEGFIHIHVHKA